MSADCWGIAFHAALIAIHLLGLVPHGPQKGPWGRSVFRLALVDVDDASSTRGPWPHQCCCFVCVFGNTIRVRSSSKALKHVPCFSLSVSLVKLAGTADWSSVHGPAILRTSSPHLSHHVFFRWREGQATSHACKFCLPVQFYFRFTVPLWRRMHG